MKKIFIALICVIAGLYLADRYFNFSLYDLLPPQQYPLSLTEQERAEVAQKQPQPIPSQVYDLGTQNNKWADVFYADKKVIFLIDAPGSPDVAGYKKMYRNFLRGNMDLRLSYLPVTKRVEKVETKGCTGEYCAGAYLGEHCGPGVCIINPRLREIVTDHSHNPQVTAALLEKFKDW